MSVFYAKKLKYRGFEGCVWRNNKNENYHGNLTNVTPGWLWAYEGKTMELLKRDFRKTIKAYIKFVEGDCNG